MSDLHPVDFLVIGHVTQDVVAEGYRVGGTATYAGCTARRLGWQTGILTSAAPDFSFPPELDGAHIYCLPAAHTTTFENIYRNGTRQQRLYAVAGAIAPSDVPLVWRQTPVVLLGPMADELAPHLAGLFPRSRVGVTPQGWMRRWDNERWVHYRRWPFAAQVLAQVNALVLSEQDLGDDGHLLDDYAARVEVMVLTQSARGCTVYWQGRKFPVPPRPANEVDPTGAGDVFAAAFLIRWQETGDPLAAARFANVVASFSVEGLGITAIPTRAQVERYLAAHPLALEA